MNNNNAANVISSNPQRIFLVGNPNSGKTSMFNAITGERHHVGNWPGVTVERLEGITHTPNGDLHLIDLPGTYSLTPATPEEALVLGTIDDAEQGTILNIVDTTNLIRNLFLTTQLIELGFKPVISMNCYDAFNEAGGMLDLSKFTTLSGCDAYPTVARNGQGIQALTDYLSNLTFTKEKYYSALALPETWQNAVNEVLKLKNLTWETAKASQKYNAINELSRPNKEENKELSEIRNNLITALNKETKSTVTPNTLACSLAADRYHRIEKMIAKCAQIPAKTIPLAQQQLDKVLTSKYFGFPIFILVMAFVFWTTFTIGKYPMDWLDSSIDWLCNILDSTLRNGLLKELLIDAAIRGVGGVIVFIPNILILFFWIVLLEDSGYMSRAAFIVDRMMKSMGLQGRAFIPMVMGLGCNVPAIMATRIIDSRFQRLLTMFLIPMVSCSARLPVLVLLCGTFFPENPSMWMFLLFFINFVVLLLIGHICSVAFKTIDNSPFLLEMPPYRMPTGKSIWNMLKEKAEHFIEKAGTIVLAGSILIWALSAFPRNVQLSFDYEKDKASIETEYFTKLSELKQTESGFEDIQKKLNEEKSLKLSALENKKNIEETEQRYMAKIGKFFHPIMEPFGFTWRETVSLIPGFLAKESIVSTLTVLYLPYDDDLGKGMRKNGMTPLKAFVFMLFTLLYMPCIATLGVLWKESGSMKFTVGSLFCYFALAYGVSFGILKVSEILISKEGRINETVIVIVLALVSLMVLVNRLLNGLRGKMCCSDNGCGCGNKNCANCPARDNCNHK